MKIKASVFALFFFTLCYSLKAQNLVPNFSFEDENPGRVPQCNYGTGSSAIASFDLDIDKWWVARHNNDKGEDAPNWVDATTNACLTSGLRYPCAIGSNYLGGLIFNTPRFVTIERVCVKKCNIPSKARFKHGAIRVQISPGGLSTSPVYVLRFKYTPIKGYSPVSNPTLSTNNIIRIFLTKWGPAWESNSSNNQKLELPALYDSYITTGCFSWRIHEQRFTIPSGFNDLKNLVFYAEENGIAIDDVEFYQECPNTISVQNITYNTPTYSPNAINGNNFTEKAANYVVAGKNVGLAIPQGNVVVDAGAVVTYTAGTGVVLQNGFVAESGSHFTALISYCPNNYFRETEEDTKYEMMTYSEEFKQMVYPEELEYIAEMNRLKNLEDIEENQTELNEAYFLEQELSFKEINISSEFDATFSYVVLDVLGKEVFSGTSSSNSARFSYSAFPEGLYIVKIISAAGQVSKKVIF